MLSLQNLVAHSVDYAGLFPPAGLSMTQTVTNYAAYIDSPSKDMLGRIVVPASRLDEFSQAVAELQQPATSSNDSAWKVSALVPTVDRSNQSAELKQTISQISAFNQRHQNPSSSTRALQIDSIEIKTNSIDQIELTLDVVPRHMSSYLEIDCQSDPVPAIEYLAQAGQTNTFAKIRTGGIVADQIPSPYQVARFIRACASKGVPFKATAGLHHPLRNEYRLTYDENPPCGFMHGFINVFVATVMAFEHGIEIQTIEEILANQDMRNFQFKPEQLVWRDFIITAEQIRAIRKKSIQSFGSCSFEEPTRELSGLGFPRLFRG